MDYNWKRIKEQILACSKVAFAECGIIVDDAELEEDVIIFNNFIHLNTSYIEIANLRHDMTRSLQEVCVSGFNNVGGLKLLCTNIDTFLKKLLPFIGIKRFIDIKDDGEMRLLKATGLWGTSIPDFKINVPASFAGNTSGLLILGNANLTRNELIHTSPAWDIAETAYRLRYVLSLFVLLIHRFKAQLIAVDSNLSKQETNHFDDNEEYALLYDYISYGNSSVEIKRRYVSTFVRHQLFRSVEISEKDLLDKMARFSEGTLDDNASKRLLNELEKNNSIVPIRHAPKTYALSEEEKNRIKEAQENYDTAIQNNNSSIQDVIDRYGIQISVDYLNEAIMNHLEAQYNYDIEEAIGDSSVAEKEDYKKLVEKLKLSGCPEDKCKAAYEELLSINRDNDIMVRISAGKAFRKISDPGMFNDYVRKADRNVWLDTQIILYLLCHNEDYSTYNNPYYKTAIALFGQHSNYANFHYKLPLFYLKEIIYQMRQALLLISVVDQPFAQGKKMSQNVFYRHYCYLYTNDGLPETVDSFAKYMEDNFLLFEDDAFDKDCNTIIENIVKERLNEYKISVEFIDALLPAEIECSENLLIEVVQSEGLNPKQGKLLHNDAFMGGYLFKNTDEQKPIFITLDNCFEPYRKKYVKRYVRSGSFNWHLFSPSAFVNHLDFIDFRVNPDNLTDDLISMVETSEMKDKTLNFIDRFNRFLDIPQLSSNQRKKYIAWVSDLFLSKEFSYSAETSIEEASPQIMRFMEAQDSVFSHFFEQGSEKLKEFQLMLRDEDLFKKYIYLLSDFSTKFEANKEDLYLAVEGNLDSYKQSIKD